MTQLHEGGLPLPQQVDRQGSGTTRHEVPDDGLVGSVDCNSVCTIDGGHKKRCHTKWPQIATSIKTQRQILPAPSELCTWHIALCTYHCDHR
eukprot:5597808-Amphidinium_carterae.1